MQIDFLRSIVYNKNMDSLPKRYDRLYKETSYPFGKEPIFLIKEVVKYLKTGHVLDVGAGDGRNVLYLARQGFDISAVDVSKVAINKIREVAKKENIFVNTVRADARKMKIVRRYDLISAIFILHHLSRIEALTLINGIMAKTKPHGLNIIAAFTANGDFYRNNPKTHNFYLQHKELKSLYAEWEIIRYKERNEEALAKRVGGSPMKNKCAYLLAQKRR